MSLIWPTSRRDIGVMPMSIGWCRDILLQLLEISKLQPDNTLVASFRLTRKIFTTLLSLSINLPSCNSYTRLSTKIFSKGVVWPTKRGFELSPLPEQGHGFMPLLHPPVIWYSLKLHFRILSVCDWEYLFSGKVCDMFIEINPLIILGIMLWVV